MVPLIHPTSLREYVELAVEIALAEQVDAATALDLAAARLVELAQYEQSYERTQQAQIVALQVYAAEYDAIQRAQARQLIGRIRAQRKAQARP